MAAVLRGVALVVTVLYPLGIYFGLRYFDPRTLVLLLVIVAGIRWLSLERSPVTHWLWLPLVALLGAWTWLAQTDLGLKLYPVFVNLSFLALFAWSLRHPPSMVERFARQSESDLPVRAITYTRNVTGVWCAFFVVNALIAGATAVWASDEWWALYNGLLAYLLMALLFAAEWLVRQRVMRADNG